MPILDNTTDDMSETAAEVEPMKPSANASSRGLVRNALTGYLSTFVGMATGFLLTPFLLHHLGTNRYGLWMLLNSTIGYVGLVEIGIGTAVAKRVAECLATGDRKRLEQVLGTAFVIYCVVAVLVMLVTAVLMFYVGRMFHLDADATRIARICLFVLGVNQAVNFLFTSQSAILFGAGRMDLMTGVSVALSLAASLAQVALLFHGGDLVALAWITVGTTVATGSLGYWVIRKNLHSVSIKPRSATMIMMRELLKFGSRNAAVSICGIVAFGSDTLVIGLLLPISAIAPYVIAAKLAGLMRVLATKPIDVCMPAYSHSSALKDTNRQFCLFTNSVMLALGLAIPIVIVIAAFGKRLIFAWVGAGHDQAYPILVVLAIALLLQLPGHACFSILTGTEDNIFLIKIGSVSAAFNLIISIILTHQLGAIGVAYGTLLNVAITDFIVLPFYVCGRLNRRYLVYLQSCFRPLLLPSAASFALFLLLKQFAFSGSIETTCLLTSSVLCVFWMFFLFVGPVRQLDRFHKLRRVE